ncbi:hypothetical protein PRZ48_011726 [Zasmidium cellare]|uniref:Phosphatidylethanolamine-binding protein n=1 Tax=Zasmidium cellare TaxID=395010 RepID=A0ABR0E7T5_ZASCE|nr:hypothetical protein PRZ48_011726 [Zasmidium cellare]
MRFAQIASLLVSLVPTAFSAPVEERQACGTGITPAEASRVRASFTSAGIVPTLIPTINPKVKLSITYGTKNVDLGTQTSTLDTLLPPTFSFTAEPGAPADATYSFFMVDPDVPGPQGAPVLGVRVNFLHWYISGVKPCSSSGNTVTFYELPTPASPGEQHRYTWLVYREPAGYKPNAIQAQVRPAFDLLGYTTRGGLGFPIGGNYMLQSITNLPSKE